MLLYFLSKKRDVILSLCNQHFTAIVIFTFYSYIPKIEEQLNETLGCEPYLSSKMNEDKDPLQAEANSGNKNDNNNNNSLVNDQETSLLHELKVKLFGDVFFSGKTLDDSFLLKFLRVRDHDVTQAADLLKGYFSMRKDHPELFKLPSEIIEVFKDKVFSISPKKNSSGELVMIFRPGHWNPSKYDAYHIAAGPVPFLEIEALDEGIQSKGMLEVLDFANISWKQFMAMPPSLHKLSADLSERAIPIKFKKVHIVNQGRMVDMLWAVMRPFVSEEMKQRLSFHGTDFSQLHQDIDQDLLPKELGGTREEEFPYDEEYIKDLDNKVQSLWDRYPA